MASKILAVTVIARSIRQPLNNDRRRHLLAQVQEHPGATFRELVRRSGIPAGTTRHHLTILRRAGLIVEHGHRSTRRFFENHGKFEANWTQVIALREPGLQELHDWIAQQKAPVSQKAAIQNFEPAGWSRSTTQHRLARLVAHGALQVRLQGRLKLYHVPPPTRPPGVVHLAPAPPPAQPPVGLGAPTA